MNIRWTTLLSMLSLSVVSGFAQSPEQKLLFKRAHTVMEQHCFDCHGVEKQKGDLRMDSLEALLKGGESEEPALVQGHADQSEMMYRIHLPTVDDDVMPPSKKDRMSEREIMTLTEWIDDGASWIPEVLGDTPALSAMEVDAMHKDLGVDLNEAMSPEEIKEFKNTIEIVFRNNCTGCHGPEKSKGELRLDTKKLAFRGGENGPVIVPGKPAESELYIRMTLPHDDDDHMPPKEKTPVSPAQIAQIETWIAAGARWPEPITKLSRGGDNHFTQFEKSLSPKAEADIEALKNVGVFIEPLIWDEGGLRVIMGHVPTPLSSEDFERLKPFSDQIRWLDVSRGDITPGVIRFIGSLNELVVLHLENTHCTDDQLKQLSGLSQLEYLNLHSTKITSAAIPTLRKFPALRKLYVWNTGIDEAGVKQLQKNRDQLKVIHGF